MKITTAIFDHEKKQASLFADANEPTFNYFKTSDRSMVLLLDESKNKYQWDKSQPVVVKYDATEKEIAMCELVTNPILIYITCVDKSVIQKCHQILNKEVTELTEEQYWEVMKYCLVSEFRNEEHRNIYFTALKMTWPATNRIFLDVDQFFYLQKFQEGYNCIQINKAC